MPKGTLLIRAAEQLGIQIPRFCDHPLLDPAGACRQCLVEVRHGQRPGHAQAAASCTTTVMPGMVVKTQLTSPVADKAQQGVMELLLINHPLDCPICDKGGECPLQNQAMSNGRAESRFHDDKRTFPKPIAISSKVLLDRERCVLCQRCTRFSEQIAGDPFIDLLERGAQQQIGTSDRRAVPVLLLRQHRADLPGRRADRRVLPVPGPPVRPAVAPTASASTARPAARCAPTGGAARSPAGWPATTRRSTRSGTATRAAGRSSTPTQADRLTDPAGARRGRRPRRGELARGARAGRARVCARRATAAASACCPAAGSPTRTPTPTRSSPGSRSAPTTSTSGPARLATRNSASSARTSPGVTPDARVLRRRWRRRRPCCWSGFEPEEESPIVFLRLRKVDPARTRRKVCAVAPFASRGLDQARRHAACQAVPGDEAAALDSLDSRVARRAGPRRRADPGRRAAGDRARRADRGGRAGRSAPAPGWPGCRGAPATAARSTPAPADAAARRPAGHRRRRPGRGRAGLGRERADRARPRHSTRSWPRPETASWPRWSSAGSIPADLADPALAADGAGAVGFVVSLELRRERGHRPRRRGVPGRAGGREGRPLRQLGRAAPSVRADARPAPGR